MQTLNSVVGIIQLHKLYTCSNLYAIKKWCNNRRICLQALKCTSITWFHVSHFQDLKLWNTHIHKVYVCFWDRERGRETKKEKLSLHQSLGWRGDFLDPRKQGSSPGLLIPHPIPPHHPTLPSIYLPPQLLWDEGRRADWGVECVCVGVKG